MTTRKDQQCATILLQMDSFIDGNLEVEAATAMASHLEHCAGCEQELSARRSLRARMRSAVQGIDIPPYLEARIRAHVKADRKSWALFWKLGAVAAGVLVIAFTTMAYNHGHMRWTRASQESYISSLSGQVASIIRVGLGDHVHCAVFRKYPKNPPTMPEFVKKMGPQYRGIIPIVREHVPSDFQLVLAHLCTYHKRQFVHMVLRNDSALLSVMITRKSNTDTFHTDEIVPQLSEAGIPIYQGSVHRFHVAAFQSEDHLVYVISDMPAPMNIQLMQAMAPALKTYLAKLEG